MIGNNEKHFEAKKKSDWLKLFEICFKFVSFFLNQPNESGNSKSGLNFEGKTKISNNEKHVDAKKKANDWNLF